MSNLKTFKNSTVWIPSIELRKQNGQYVGTFIGKEAQKYAYSEPHRILLEQLADAGLTTHTFSDGVVLTIIREEEVGYACPFTPAKTNYLN